MKKIIIILVVIIISGAVGFKLFFLKREKENQQSPVPVTNQIISPENNFSFMEIKNGVKIETLRLGVGVEAQNGDDVVVHYTGTLQDGTKFDSSLDRGTPFSFTLGVGQVIKGWDIGVSGMKIGEKIKLTIPPDLAYGANGIPGAIPPNATLIFEVELLGINK